MDAANGSAGDTGLASAGVPTENTPDTERAIPAFYEPAYPIPLDSRPNGFVAVPVAIVLTPLWLSANPFDARAALIDLLLLARVVDDDLDGPAVSNGPRLRSGELWISERGMARRWDWSRERVGRFLQRCMDEGVLVREGKSTPRGTRYRFAEFDGHSQPLVLCANGWPLDALATCVQREIGECPTDCPLRDTSGDSQRDA